MSEEMKDASYPVRGKYWEELTAEQKVDRLGREYSYLDARFRRLTEEVSKLMKHDHVNHEIMVPLDSEVDAPYTHSNPLNFGPKTLL